MTRIFLRRDFINAGRSLGKTNIGFGWLSGAETYENFGGGDRGD